GHHASSAANGARKKVAAPRSNRAPISIAGTMRQGRKSAGSPLKAASARSTRRPARREGNSAASIERSARTAEKVIRALLCHRRDERRSASIPPRRDRTGAPQARPDLSGLELRRQGLGAAREHARVRADGDEKASAL